MKLLGRVFVCESLCRLLIIPAGLVRMQRAQYGHASLSSRSLMVAGTWPEQGKRSITGQCHKVAHSRKGVLMNVRTCLLCPDQTHALTRLRGPLAIRSCSTNPCAAGLASRRGSMDMHSQQLGPWAYIQGKGRGARKCVLQAYELLQCRAKQPTSAVRAVCCNTCLMPLCHTADRPKATKSKETKAVRSVSLMSGEMSPCAYMHSLASTLWPQDLKHRCGTAEGRRIWIHTNPVPQLRTLLGSTSMHICQAMHQSEADVRILRAPVRMCSSTVPCCCDDLCSSEGPAAALSRKPAQKASAAMQRLTLALGLLLVSTAGKCHIRPVQVLIHGVPQPSGC